MHKFLLSIAILTGFLDACKPVEQDGQEQYTIPDHVPNAQGIILQELIYPLENRPTPQCHASTIEESSTGVIAAWFGGTHENHEDVGIWVSKNDGNGWTTPVEVVNGIQNDSLRYPCWNPVLFMTSSGQLQLHYKVGPSPREWWGMIMLSDDEGVSWSAPRKLGSGPNGDLIGPVKNKAIQLADGTIISPSSRETQLENGELIWNVHFELSHDMGKSWSTIGPIHNGKEIQAIQPSLLIHGAGKLQILCRTRQLHISESWSFDNGKSWNSMELTSLPNPNAGTDAVTLQDGRHLLIYNHTIRESDFPKGREMLNLAISNDGMQWKVVMTLEKKENMEYSYPAIIQTRNGNVHMSYTYNRRTVKHVILDPALL